MTGLRSHLTTLPADLAKALDETYREVIDHHLRDEPDDAQVDAGRFCEAVLRYLEWKMGATYTAIDGKSKPNRKKVVGAAQNDTSLEPTLRAQVPQTVELVMDFRNNRNSAHLGSIDANNMDASTVVQNCSWVVGEIIRIESSKSTAEIQQVLDQLAERHVPLIQKIGDTPIVLDPGMRAADKALVLLYADGAPVPIAALRKWAEYANSTHWRDKVIAPLRKAKLVHVDKDGMVHLLRPGEIKAQAILLAAGSEAA